MFSYQCVIVFHAVFISGKAVENKINTPGNYAVKCSLSVVLDILFTSNAYYTDFIRVF